MSHRILACIIWTGLIGAVMGGCALKLGGERVITYTPGGEPRMTTAPRVGTYRLYEADETFVTLPVWLREGEPVGFSRTQGPDTIDEAAPDTGLQAIAGSERRNVSPDARWSWYRQ